MKTSRIAVCRVSLAYAAFVVYGSLMPWRLRWRPFDDALSAYLGLAEHAHLTFSFSDFATNVAIFVVLALLWGASLSERPALPWVRFVVVLAGSSLFSAAIEFAQLYAAQRTSSIYDWAANSIGAAIGAAAWALVEPRLAAAAMQALRASAQHPTVTEGMRRAAIAAALPYVIILCAANHWFSMPWLGFREAVARAAEVSLLPFFYYQEASTLLALTSMVWQVVLYAPIGVGLRALAASGTRVRPLTAAVIGAGVAAVMEGGRLFVVGQHPDLGNVVVAALAAVGGFMVWPTAFGICRRVAARSRRRVDSAESDTAYSARQKVASLLARATSLGLAAAVAAALYKFPVLQAPLAGALLLYAVVLVRWPLAWLWVLPAVLPVIDLAPLSGWFFFDEFDMAVLVTVAVLLWRRASDPRQPLSVGLGPWLWVAFGSSVALGTLMGLVPFQALDANAFASYHSHYNALRIAKGFLWAFVLIRLAAQHQPAIVAKRLASGILFGLAGATALALWERQTYPGLFDFSQGYRVGAFFSSMHNGGSHIEAYFVMTVPFLLAAIYLTKSTLLRLASAALLVAATYVLAVTFARGGYAAFALALLLGVGLLGRIAYIARRPRFLRWTVVSLAVAVALAGAVVSGSFAQHRLATSSADLDVRIAHWREALRIMDPGLVTELFGMGLGRFPDTYYYRNVDNDAPATFSYEIDAGGSYLKLGSGNTVYVEQFVDVRPQRNYRLSIDLRSAGGPTRLNVLLCARTYFMSYGCESAVFTTAPAGAGWTHRETTIRSNELGAGGWLSRRPVKLSLENTTRGTTVDVRRIALNDADGRNLIQNGDFSRGNDHWFFSSNFNHLPWHVKNLWVGLYFDLGWFGVATFAILLAYALGGLVVASWCGSPFAAVALASAVGFLCVGLFDSLFDAPRLTTLFLLVLAAFGSPVRRMVATDPDSAATGSRGRAASVAKSLEAAPGSVSAVPPATTVPLDLSTVMVLAVGVVIVALLAAIVSHLPGIPYEVEALLNPYHPFVAPVVFAMFAFWAAGVPMLAARWLETGWRAALLFPIVVVLHAVVAWALIRQAVLPGMIHKVAGFPILRWPWEWETLLRFSTLQSALFLLLTGGCVVKRVAMRQSKPRTMLIWLFWAVCLVPPLHYVIVGLAATDNLTELMAGGGGARSSLLLALWCVLVGATGSMFGDDQGTNRKGMGLRLFFAVSSIAFGYVILWFGLESNVQKYGTTFSALQFLLSSDRQHYAGGWELGIRYVMFHSGIVGLIALAQFPFRHLWGGQRPEVQHRTVMREHGSAIPVRPGS